MIPIFASILAGSLLIGCKSEGLQHNRDYSDMPASFSAEGMTKEEYEKIVAETKQIDYVFYEIPLSLNEDAVDALYRDLDLISTDPAPGIPLGCKPIARKIYMGDNDVVIEADLYFSDGCYLQIFIRDQRPLFGNLLNTDGAVYYEGMMRSIEEERRKLQPQLANPVEYSPSS
ncbi:MAG: hypothetical protein AAFQ02_02310 [Bacteroidota bacterium]